MIKTALQNGAILGAIGVVYGLIMILFVGTDNWMTMMFMGLGYMVMFVTLLVVWSIKYRKSQNNVLSYGKAFGFMLTTWAVASTIGVAFNMTYMLVINPEYANEMIDMTISQTEEWLVNTGMSDEEIENTLIQVQEDTAKSFTAVGMLTGLVWQYVMAAIFSALISLFVWKRPPSEPMPIISAEES